MPWTALTCQLLQIFLQLSVNSLRQLIGPIQYVLPYLFSYYTRLSNATLTHLQTVIETSPCNAFEDPPGNMHAPAAHGAISLVTRQGHLFLNEEDVHLRNRRSGGSLLREDIKKGMGSMPSTLGVI